MIESEVFELRLVATSFDRAQPSLMRRCRNWCPNFCTDCHLNSCVQGDVSLCMFLETSSSKLFHTWRCALVPNNAPAKCEVNRTKGFWENQQTDMQTHRFFCYIAFIILALQQEWWIFWILCKSVHLHLQRCTVVCGHLWKAAWSSELHGNICSDTSNRSSKLPVP